MHRWNTSAEMAIQREYIIANRDHWGPNAIIHDSRNVRLVCINCWHHRSLFLNEYWNRDTYIKMDGEMVNLLEKIDPAYYKDFIYIYPPKKLYVCRIQEGYIRKSRSITILLGNNLKNPRRNGLTEEGIWLMCYEQNC